MRNEIKLVWLGPNTPNWAAMKNHQSVSGATSKARMTMLLVIPFLLASCVSNSSRRWMNKPFYGSRLDSAVTPPLDAYLVGKRADYDRVRRLMYIGGFGTDVYVLLEKDGPQELIHEHSQWDIKHKRIVATSMAYWLRLTHPSTPGQPERELGETVAKLWEKLPSAHGKDGTLKVGEDNGFVASEDFHRGRFAVSTHDLSPEISAICAAILKAAIPPPSENPQ